MLDTSHWRRIFDGLLVGLSDTQIITALALMIVTGVRTSCTISAYHYNLVCQLVLMSTMVHFCSMTVIEHYFYNKFLAAVRILFITVNFIFGFFFFARRAASDSFPVGIPSNEFKTNRTSMVIAADCFMDNTTAPYLPNDGSKSYLGIIQYGLLFAFFIAATMLSLVHTHMFNKDKPFKAKHWTYWARGLMSVAALGVSIWIICYLTSFRNSMRDSGWFGGDDGEYSWDSFGQLVPLILLILPLLQFVESATSKFIAFSNIDFTNIFSRP